MSHEIRTPLNAMLGILVLLLRFPLEPDQRRRAEIAHVGAGHLLALLNDILDLSRLQADCLALQPKPVNIRALIEGITAILSASAQERGLGLRTRLDPRLPDWLVCDPVRLRQVLLNLLGNVATFTDDGEVVLSVAHNAALSGGVLGIEVRDTGPGIAPQVRTGLFRRFVHSDNLSTRHRAGTGLGLAISRQLI